MKALGVATHNHTVSVGGVQKPSHSCRFCVEPEDVGKVCDSFFGVYQQRDRRFTEGDVGRVIEVIHTRSYTVWSFLDEQEN